MNKVKLIEDITASASKTIQLLEDENIKQFKSFFIETESVDGTKHILPKMISFAIPFIDGGTGKTNFKKVDIPLMSLVPINFLALQKISLRINALNTAAAAQEVISFTNTNQNFNTLVENYTKTLLSQF